MAGKFEIYKDKAGEFRFRLKASNGQNILASEGYKERASALNGVESVKKNAADAGRFEKKESSNGKPYFVLKAGNHQVIGNSEMYESEDARDNGISSVMSNAPEASVDDQTS
ncbi:MAG: YegP family protein [Pseudomonadota bacterium]